MGGATGEEQREGLDAAGDLLLVSLLDRQGSAPRLRLRVPGGVCRGDPVRVASGRE